MAKVVKPAGTTARKQKRETQSTTHGFTQKEVRQITKDTWMGSHGEFDVQVTGESPGKRGTRRP